LATLFVFLITLTADAVPATSWSPVGDDLFHTVFGFTGVAVSASMIAYLLAQLIDIRIYHFWKKLTRGKKLWLRNNASTMTSQLVDTATVLLLLCFFGAIEWKLFWPLLGSGFLFKILVAAADTPILYALVYFYRKQYRISATEDLTLFNGSKS
jgi:uncharacterized integral membrane protein (TIGR00697 family)